MAYCILIYKHNFIFLILKFGHQYVIFLDMIDKYNIISLSILLLIGKNLFFSLKTNRYGVYMFDSPFLYNEDSSVVCKRIRN